jgi:processive 1,2-diacylglycerol beta-glucosyltransferase
MSVANGAAALNPPGGAATNPSPAGGGVLILSARVGAGHVQAARAVVEAIQQARPGAGVRLEDVMDHVPRLFRAYYQGGFVLSMTRLGRLYGLGFDITNLPDTPRRLPSERLRLASERFWLKGLARKVAQWRPDVVVCTHFLVGHVVAGLVAAGRLRARLAVVVTDHYPHRWWHCEGVDHWFVPDAEGRDRFVRWGTPAERITVCDIPVRAKWTLPVDRERARADWRLPADRPIVLLSGGTDFVCGPVVAIARGILAACPRSHVVVLAGRNKELLAALSRVPQAAGGPGGGERLTPVSFTDRAHELVALSALMVTKPGGVTTAECCAMGCPMVLLRPVPGQESCNAAYLSAHGAAVVPGGIVKVIEAVRQLLEDEPRRAAMSARARALHRPAATLVAAKVSEWLSTPAP